MSAVGVAMLGLVGCDSDMLHQDRPGGSDYTPSGYGRSADRMDEAQFRQFCARNPDARECRRY
jgi:hypothetical protein